MQQALNRGEEGKARMEGGGHLNSIRVYKNRYPIYDQKGQNRYAIYDQNGLKTLFFAAANI